MSTKIDREKRVDYSKRIDSCFLGCDGALYGKHFQCSSDVALADHHSAESKQSQLKVHIKNDTKQENGSCPECEEDRRLTSV